MSYALSCHKHTRSMFYFVQSGWVSFYILFFVFWCDLLVFLFCFVYFFYCDFDTSLFCQWCISQLQTLPSNKWGDLIWLDNYPNTPESSYSIRCRNISHLSFLFSELSNVFMDVVKMHWITITIIILTFCQMLSVLLKGAFYPIFSFVCFLFFFILCPWLFRCVDEKNEEDVGNKKWKDTKRPTQGSYVWVTTVKWLTNKEAMGLFLHPMSLSVHPKKWISACRQQL